MAQKGILIVGGGIGGLTAALALQQAGLPVSISEQASAMGEVGAGVMLSPNATRVLEGLGLSEPLARLASMPDFNCIRNYATGDVISTTQIGEASRERHGSPTYYIHRSDLHGLLLEAVLARDPGCVRLGLKFVGVDDGGDGVLARFADGSTQQALALIGADGIKSGVRDYVAPEATTRFTGNVAWRGLVPAERLPPELRHVESHNWVGPKKHVVCYGVRGGALQNFVAIAEQPAWEEEGWNAPAKVSDVLDAFQGWHPDILDTIRATPAGGCFKWGLFDRDPLPRWSIGRVTLLGDAAHPMLPFMGQGAAMAIEDAAVLAGALRAQPDVEAALQAYEAVRLQRTAWVQMQARANQSLFHDGAAASGFDEDRDKRARVLYDYDAANVF